jgi:hypothetical protein
MKEISLTQGQVALVDDADFDWLNQWRWYAVWERKTYYAARMEQVDGKRRVIKMHRALLGVTNPKIKIDHKNNCGLDNQRHNLRKATHAQNLRNSTRYKNNASGFRGVYEHKRNLKNNWQASIQGKHIGYFATAIEAARAYDTSARRIFGEFAALNFPS